MKKNNTCHLVIIDALNLIRRIDGALSGFSDQSTLDIKQLIEISSQALTRIIRGHRPSHIIAVFDGDGDNWRRQLYPQYKENRKPMAAELANQLTHIQQHWRRLGVGSLLSQHDEADDLIATLSIKMIKFGGKVTIVSTDQGFNQLLNLGINVWDHFSGEWQNLEKVQQKFGIKSEQLLDYWSIVGQSGNRIPGVSGMGPKAATALLSQYDSLTLAFAATPAPADKLLTKLHRGKAQAKLSYRLVKLKSDLALGINLKDLRYRQPDNAS